MKNDTKCKQKKIIKPNLQLNKYLMMKLKKHELRKKSKKSQANLGEPLKSRSISKTCNL